MSNLSSLVEAALEANPSKFNKICESELKVRIFNSINARKAEVVAGMLGLNESVEEEVEDVSEED